MVEVDEDDEDDDDETLGDFEETVVAVEDELELGRCWPRIKVPPAIAAMTTIINTAAAKIRVIAYLRNPRFFNNLSASRAHS